MAASGERIWPQQLAVHGEFLLAAVTHPSSSSSKNGVLSYAASFSIHRLIE